MLLVLLEKLRVVCNCISDGQISMIINAELRLVQNLQSIIQPAVFR